MSVQSRPMAFAPLLPENAPFTPEQRSWLNGFFAGLLSLNGPGAVGLSSAEAAALVPAPGAAPAGPKDPLDDGDDGEAPWHDPSMVMGERMTLSEGRPLRRRMMAAMAQQDCGQCGYNCANYSDAIVTGAEKKLNLCAPGGKETARMLKKLAEEMTETAVTADTGVAGSDPKPDPAPAATVQRGTSRDNPAPAVFLSRRRLNAEGSEKETHHIEFDLRPSGLTYEPGDAFGLYANNPMQLVRAIARAMGVPLDDFITAEGHSRTLFDWLTHCKSLTPAPDALFLLYAGMASDEKEKARLEKMAEGEGSDGFDVLSVLRAFPHIVPSPFKVIETLEPLQPRLYSISSSPRATPGHVSLTVDVVRYEIDQRLRFGVASTFLAERVQGGDPVRVYIQKSHGFGLPKDDSKRVIMVGPGTGVAPFRAFLQDRMVGRPSGPAWLFFGHQREASDFFYRDEMEEFMRKGALQKLSLAWSRDPGTPKTYVQDKMRQEADELWTWLSDGAHFYICGDAKRMAADVEKALVEVVGGKGGLDEAAAKAYLAEMKKDGRFQADVY